MRTILHIDVNSAFLSWTAKKLLSEGYKADIRTIPSAIAGDPKKRTGIVLAKSDPAKKSGVKTGMPLFEAMNLCPEIKFFPPEHSYYGECSNALFNLLEEYSDTIEKFSVDEEFLDYTNSVALFGEPLEFAKTISTRIKSELGFTVNIGISSNKLLAKMASEMEKPDKIHTLYPDEVQTKMHPLPVSDLFGIGRRTAMKLKTLNINTIGELSLVPKERLITLLGDSAGNYAYNASKGIDDSPVISNKYSLPKSVGNSKTFSFDLIEKDEILKKILYLCDKTSSRLRELKGEATTISLLIKYADFKSISKQVTLPVPTSSSSSIYKNAKSLFESFWNRKAVRLIGISLSNLSFYNSSDGELFVQGSHSTDRPKSTSDHIVDEIRKKYGSAKITKASLLDDDA